MEIGRSDTWRPTTIQCLLSPRVRCSAYYHRLVQSSCLLDLKFLAISATDHPRRTPRMHTEVYHELFVLPKRSPEPTEHSMRHFFVFFL